MRMPLQKVFTAICFVCQRAEQQQQQRQHQTFAISRKKKKIIEFDIFGDFFQAKKKH